MYHETSLYLASVLEWRSSPKRSAGDTRPRFRAHHEDEFRAQRLTVFQRQLERWFSNLIHLTTIQAIRGVLDDGTDELALEREIVDAVHRLLSEIHQD